MKKLYLYLASRSKKGIKLVTTLQGPSEQIVSRVNDPATLSLPTTWERKIEEIFEQNKMLYEPWIESASNYEELKERLKHRGYTQLPMGPNPLLDLSGKIPQADTSSVQVTQSMVRKKKA